MKNTWVGTIIGLIMFVIWSAVLLMRMLIQGQNPDLTSFVVALLISCIFPFVGFRKDFQQKGKS